MLDFVVSMIETYGYFGVFLLIFIENIFPPIPSELILSFAGFLSSVTQLNFLIVVISATIGSLIGAMVLYYGGKIYKTRIIEKHLHQTGKFFGFSNTDLQKVLRIYHNRQELTVFACRLIPVARSLISIPAGMAEMELRKFILMTVSGSFLWNTIIVAIGYYLGKNWTQISAILMPYTRLIYALLCTGLISWFLILRNGRKI